MLTRLGRIAARRGRQLEIEFPEQPPACAGCRSGCGLLQLANVFRRPAARLHLNTLDADDWPTGRPVRVSMPLRWLPRALLIAYGLPLLGLLLAAVLAQGAWPGRDGMLLLACAGGLSASVVAARLLSRHVTVVPRLAPAENE